MARSGCGTGNKTFVDRNRTGRSGEYRLNRTRRHEFKTFELMELSESETKLNQVDTLNVAFY